MGLLNPANNLSHGIESALLTIAKAIKSTMTIGNIELGYTEKTSDTSLTTSATTIVSVSVAVVSGRKYKITGMISDIIGATASGVNISELYADASVINRILTARLGTGSQVGACLVAHYTASATGTVTFALKCTTSTSTSTAKASSTYPNFILVEQL